MKHGQWINDPETGERGQLISLRKSVWNLAKRYYPDAVIGALGGIMGYVLAMQMTGGL